MNITEEVAQMIDEMRVRTGKSPGMIVCNHETLNLLWDNGRGIYSSASDIENNTGYVSRFMGTPIIVSEEVETGRFLIVPEENMDADIPFRIEYQGRPLYENRTYAGDNWGIIGGPFGDGGDWVDAQHYPSKPQMSAVDDADVEIDEDCFMAIIRGGGNNASA